jgi:transcriptional regulator with XRE-family HTH domain
VDFESTNLGSTPSPAVNHTGTPSVRRVVYYDSMDNNIGECLREARIRSGMPQTDLAIRCGVSKETVGRWERGDRTPRASDLIVLSRVLGFSSDALLGLDPDFTPKKRSRVERLRIVTR